MYIKYLRKGRKDENRKFILDNGGKVLKDIKKVPTGENTTIRHNDEKNNETYFTNSN